MDVLEDEGFKEPPKVTKVPWLRQLFCVLCKNVLLLSRRPFYITFMCLSTVGSVLLAFPIVHRHEKPIDFGTVPLTACGTVVQHFVDSTTNYLDIPLTYNEPWRNGLAVIVMALGPMFHGLFAFVIVQVDIQTEMLGVLRGLGLRDSVFWASWWVPFLGTSFLNALFGALTTSFLSNHAFENIYFMGILGSFFFLNIALVGAALFLAAVCGTSYGGASTWCIVLMVVAQWGPYLTQVVQQFWMATDPDTLENSFETPLGLFWVNRNTTYDDGQCHKPIISETQGGIWRTDAERKEFPQDEFFVGCYFSAGFANSMWNRNRKIGIAIMYMFPSAHFSAVWANFLGYTGMPGRFFRSEHASLTSEQLAIRSLPSPPDPANGLDSSLFSQGVTLNVAEKFPPPGVSGENCPAADLKDYFCSYLNNCPSATQVSPTESPSVMRLFGFLFFLAILYTLLAAYWSQIFPGKNGAARDFFFFLRPTYWFGRSAEPEGDRASRVEIEGVRKSFGGFEAVKGVSMTMVSGEVTALLGHNGAGKTTLANILSIETDATGGDISVFGYSVADSPDEVRGLVAVCKQFDFLYPDLSAKEHLELFGGLRGVAEVDLTEMVQKWLESVDLDIVQNQYSSSFSGGMKRRLSLACSTIGGRPLIILDEPTTGMDPLSRRYVWRHIDEVKEDRVILLTTHAMEEADLLADTVAIMRTGELAAFGTPLELKSEHGSALQFSLLVKPERVEGAKRDINNHFNDYRNNTEVVAGEAGNITVKISAIKREGEDEGVDVAVLTNFVAWLEDEAASGVTEYGFSNSSLEEVFLKVTEGHQGDEEPLHLQGSNQRRDVNGGHVVENGDHLDAVDSEEEAAATLQAEGFDTDKGVSFKPVLSIWRQSLALIYFGFWRGLPRKIPVIVVKVAIVTLALWPILLATNAGGTPIAYLAAPTVAFSLLMVDYVTPVYQDRLQSFFYLMRAQGLAKPSYILGMGSYAFLAQAVAGIILMIIIMFSGLYRRPEMCIPAGDVVCEGRKTYGFKRIVELTENVFVDPDYVLSDGNKGAYVFATWQGGGFGKLFITAVAFALTTPGALFASSYLPGHKFALILVVICSLVAAIAPLIVYFITVPKKFVSSCSEKICSNGEFVETPVSDLKTAGKAFLDCVGLQVSAASNGLCMPRRTALLPQFGLFQMLSMTLIAEITFMSEPQQYVEDVFIPALKKSSGVSCRGTTCRFPYANKRFRQYLGFTILGALLLLVIGFVFVSFFSFPAGLSRKIRTRLSRWYKTALYAKEQWANGREVHEPKAELTEIFDEVISESKLVGSIVKDIRSGARRGVDVSTSKDLYTHELELMETAGDMDPLAPPPRLDPLVSSLEKENEGLVVPEFSVEASGIPRDSIPPLLAYNLRKVYPSLGGAPPKIALESLDLHVPKGQVLGLLGQNGAGKTTAIKIWAAQHEATSGLALVGGYDVSSETLKVFERLGNCPQFDIVCKSETVQRHLEFFALLKGLPMAKVKHIAQSIAISVGLGTPSVYHREAGRLSGGMRRRLSIAISLIGAPAVLLLDEPTTGLDPATRSSIWDLINSFSTSDRAVIITTHMMLEADTLCSRIAIMAHGRLKVVATQQRLKDRFGSGYLLQLNLIKSTPEVQEKALEFVRSRIHKDAELQNRQAKTLHISLPRDVNLSDVFGVLYSQEMVTEGCVNQFLLQQSSLEDVFLALGD